MPHDSPAPGRMSTVSLGTMMRVADTLNLPLATVHAVIDSHEATENDVRRALREVNDRILGARRQPHPLQLLATFEDMLQTPEEVGS